MSLLANCNYNSSVLAEEEYLEQLPTIEEYLALKDWKFTPDVEVGQHGNYYWFRSENFVFYDIFDHLPLPTSPFQIAVALWDSDDKTYRIYEGEAGWKHLGGYAVSSPTTKPPELYLGDYSAHLILDKSFDNRVLRAQLDSLSEDYALDDHENERVKSFWHTLETIQPYAYFSIGLTKSVCVIFRGAEVYKRFMDSIDWTKIDEYYRTSALESAAKMWKDLGPERGPEKCVVNDCDRLRIPLAIRCFIHQLRD